MAATATSTQAAPTRTSGSRARVSKSSESDAEFVGALRHRVRDDAYNPIAAAGAAVDVVGSGAQGVFATVREMIAGLFE